MKMVFLYRICVNCTIRRYIMMDHFCTISVRKILEFKWLHVTFTYVYNLSEANSLMEK
ncbi:unnamed protein product [Musa hybrid cultivar]